MADIRLIQGTTLPPNTITVYRDMGDGSHAQVVAAVISGSVAIPGGVVINAGTAAIGTVEVTSVVPGVGALNLGKAEDTLHAAGDVGVFMLAVRNDANAQLALTDLAYSGLTIDDVNRLKVLVTSKGATIVLTPAVTAGAYAADDAVGGLLEFVGAAEFTGAGGVIKDVIIQDDATNSVEMELWLFSETFTAMADNAPWAPSEADLRHLVGIVTTSDGTWFASGNLSTARVEVSQRYDCVGTSLFGQMVTRAIMTPLATDDISVIIGLLQD